MSFKNLLLTTGLAVLALPMVLALPVQAQDEEIEIEVEEVVVTGSYIKHSPEDAPVPIDVIDSEELFNTGNPSVVELVKTLGVSSGVDGETNQFQSNGLEGTANVNLRGLGAGRNLVLLNGRRNVFSPYAISEQQQLFVDINNIPAVALGRVELLKDGAAATYGSDAISGVVNFITRSDFEGIEFALSHKNIDGSDGDQDFGVIWGQDFGRTHLMAAFGYNKRNQLQVLERDWAIQPYAYMGNARAYTGIPNPGAYIPLDGAGIIRDPQCTNFIGDASVNNPAAPRALCTYNYAYFDNLIEEETRTNLYGELTHEFDDNMEFSLEFLYAKNEVPEWHTSPSYPPQTLVDTSLVTGRFIPSYHPGLVAMAERYPDTFGNYADATCDPSDPNNGGCFSMIFFGRPFGVSGPSALGHREYETTRLVAGLEGALNLLGSDVDYTTSLVWSQTEATRASPDTIAENWAQALRGLGGPNCTGTTPDANGCEFYNPFSNAIQYPQSKYAEISENPDFDPDLANSDGLRNWMTEAVGSNAKTGLTVFDAVLTGSTNADIDWAAGLQWRQESYTLTPFEGSNLLINPCQSEGENERWRVASQSNANALCDAGTDGTDDDYEGSGRFIFLAGATPFDDEQDIIALFGEVQVNPISDLEVQVSARYEDYGGDVGNSFDPKVAARWQATNEWVVRGSASTTFRGPTLNQLDGRITSLSFVGPTGTFKAVDTFGNSELDPEKATTLNLGVLYDADDMFADNDNLRFSFDYWSFDFTDPIIRESFNDLIAQAFADTNNDGSIGTDDQIIASSPVADRFTLAGDNTNAGNIQRIRVRMINGPDIETNGFDIAAGYSFDALQGEWDVSLQMTIISAFDVDNAAQLDALGKINDTVDYLRPIVENKAKLGIRYTRGAHLVNFIANQTGSYKDAKTPLGPDRDVEEHMTFDLHYNLALENMGGEDSESAIWVSIYNLTDEDPPFARLDLNYDPYTHNPFGQMIKVGVRHKF